MCPLNASNDFKVTTTKLILYNVGNVILKGFVNCVNYNLTKNNEYEMHFSIDSRFPIFQNTQEFIDDCGENNRSGNKKCDWTLHLC